MKRHPQRLRTVLILALLTIIATPVSAAPPPPDATYPLVVQVLGPGFVDTIRFADHTSSPMEGNWITLGGGTDAALPQITMKYSGVTQATYTRSGNQVTLATYNLNGRTVQYPPSKHQTHTPAQTITYTFRGSTAHAGKTVSVRVIPVTATALRDAASDAFRGDTSAMKSILASSVYSSTETLNVDGDLVSKTIGTLPAGDYALVIVDENPGNPYTLDVYSATAIEVLDYPSTVTAPSSVTRGTDLQIQVQLTGAGAASRRYGAVIIQQSKYKVDLVLTSDGSTEGTSLTGRGATLLEGTADSFSLAGIGLEGLDKDQLIAKLNEAYSGAEFSAAFTDYTTDTTKTVPVTTTGLNAGKFIVLIGVWEGVSDKLVAFHQREVTVSGPPAPGPTPPAPPTPGQVQAMGDTEAATALAAMGPATAANIMSQITAKKAASIMGRMATANAAAIVKEMQTKAAAAIMNEAENGVVVRVLTALEASKAAAILGEMTTIKVARVLEEAVRAGKTAQFGAYMNMLNKKKAAEILLETSPEAAARIVEGMAQDNLREAAKRVEEAIKLRLGETDPARAREMLRHVAETLKNADTGTLVNIFIEIASLPETPSTVATVLEAMDTAKVFDVVSTWIDVGSLDELGEVFSYFSDSFLSEMWRGMSAAERSALFAYLPPETVERLPEVGEFQLSGLQVSPATAPPGQAVTVSVQVENVGAEPGSYTLTLRVNGVTEGTRKLTLQPGQRQTVEWTVSRVQAGSYSVDVNGLTGSFTVQPASGPASFTLSDLTVNPATVEPGVPVTVTVKATNTGGLRGSTSVELKINGVQEDTRTVTLDPGSSTTVSFTVTRNTAGAYTVAVGSLTGGFTVTAPPPPPPGVPWAAVLAAVVVVTAVGYIIYSQRRSAVAP
ncbi:MAG: TIGR04279 domain-containing protein [Candidatus Bathyarchaeota archaeon]